jgi:acyl-coenzyme A thioesterase 13
MDHDQSPIPVGFAPLFRTSPFLDTPGPFCYRLTGQGFVTGVRVAQKHCNARGAAHGGFLVTLADIALGYAAAASGNPPFEIDHDQYIR